VRDLCSVLGYGRQAFPALLGEAINHVVRAKFAAAYRTGRQLLRIARVERDPVLLVEARYALGVACFPIGKFLAAQRHFGSGLARYDRANHAAHIAVFGQDGGAICKIRLAAALWYTGYPEKSLSRAKEALALAEEIGHPFTIAYVKAWAAIVCCHLGDPVTTAAAASGSRALSNNHGFVYWPQVNRILLAWAASRVGDRQAGVAEMAKAIADLAATGVELMRPFWCSLLANEYVNLGRTSDALATLQAGIEAATRYGQVFPLAELYRLRGELLCVMEHVEQAEMDLLDALGVAYKQRARLPELRTATSLARLRRDQGRHAEARDLLAPVYCWFTEGFDTPDLKQAKALLDELDA
jgi:predicted ATPase